MTTTQLGTIHDFVQAPVFPLFKHSLGPMRKVGSVSSWTECSTMHTGFLTRENHKTIEGAICVVDGDAGIRNSLFVLMRTLGLEAATFSTAEEFLERVGDERPGFLITEISLPGMDGFSLKRALNDRGLLFPVIGMTGEADRRKQMQAAQLGFLELVEKPFVYWSIVERVREAVGTLS
jgi:FixJ family two-component response regulator